jgi:hypothetical protein
MLDKIRCHLRDKLPEERLNRAQVHIWNEFARKLGWNDRVAQFPLKVKAEDGTTAETADLSTAFDLMDYREGRAQPPKTL